MAEPATPATNPPPRVWVVEIYYFDEDSKQWILDEQALTKALIECVGILNRLGGHLECKTQRAEIAEGRSETIGAVFRWTMFPPASSELAAESDAVPPPAATPESS